MKTAVIVGGGEIKESFAIKIINSMQEDDILIAADKGEEFLNKNNIKPDIWVGDMDSYSGPSLDMLNIELHPVRKNETDMRLALLDAISLKADRVYMLGAGGGRLDHFLANVYLLAEGYSAGIKAYILDPLNRISILGKGVHSFNRSELYGSYISFLAFGGDAKVKYLKGFSYELGSYTFGAFDTIGISNKADRDVMILEIEDGFLIMTESMDKQGDEHGN